VVLHTLTQQFAMRDKLFRPVTLSPFFISVRILKKTATDATGASICWLKIESKIINSRCECKTFFDFFKIIFVPVVRHTQTITLKTKNICNHSKKWLYFNSIIQRDLKNLQNHVL